jgi:peptidoglycan/LPS O-acetylase OafA/YrhL
LLPLAVLFSPKYGLNDLYIELISVLLIFPLGIFAGSNIRIKNIRIIKYLSIMGIISYPLYLLHVPIYSIIKKVIKIIGLDLPDFVNYSGAIFTLALLILSVVLERIYDKPVRAFLKKLNGRV